MSDLENRVMRFKKRSHSVHTTAYYILRRHVLVRFEESVALLKGAAAPLTNRVSRHQGVAHFEVSSRLARALEGGVTTGLATSDDKAQRADVTLSCDGLQRFMIRRLLSVPLGTVQPVLVFDFLHTSEYF